MSLFEENEQLLDSLEEAEHKLEKYRIDGPDSASAEEKRELALALKADVSTLAKNILTCGKDVEALGGALVLMDLIEALKKYADVFHLPALTEATAILDKMWQDSH